MKNFSRELLLRVLKLFFTGAAADTCLASRGIRDVCDTAVVSPQACIDTTQSEIYRGIFDKYGGISGKIFDNNRGHYVGGVQILNV